MYKKNLIIIFMIIMIPYCLSQSRIGRQILDTLKDNNGTNWTYIRSNYTLIFDNYYRTSFDIIPIISIHKSNLDKFTNFNIILKNENILEVTNIQNLIGTCAFELNADLENNFTIQGDGKLTIKVDVGKNIFDSVGLFVLNCNLVIKENAKIEIIMNNGEDLKGLSLTSGRLYMEDNSQLSIYIGKNNGTSSYAIKSGVYLSGNVTINSSVQNLNENSIYLPQWLSGGVTLSNYTNATFISNGTMEFHKNIFKYLGENPIIINAIETLDKFKESHKLTQKDPNKPIIFSNYFTKKEEENMNGSQFINISFFLLNLILFL